MTLVRTMLWDHVANAVNHLYYFDWISNNKVDPNNNYWLSASSEFIAVSKLSFYFTSCGTSFSVRSKISSYLTSIRNPPYMCTSMTVVFARALIQAWARYIIIFIIHIFFYGRMMKGVVCVFIEQAHARHGTVYGRLF